jgi:bacterioferritin-associated ferredoxin
MYVCICNSVTDRQIRKAVNNGADSLQAIQSQLKVGTCCGKCRDCARRVIADALAEQPTAAVGALLAPA